MIHRPTTMALASEHCPRALDFYEAGEPYDRDVFSAGIAAHAVLAEVGIQTQKAERELSFDEADSIARVVCERLMSEGRSFDGRPEPPLSADDVWRGRDIAIAYLSTRPIGPAIDAKYELGLAVDRDGKPVAYDSAEAHLRHVTDVMRVDVSGADDDQREVVTVRDYKTAWPTNEAELETTQRRVVATLAWAHYRDEADLIRVEVVNLRTGADYSIDLWTLDEASEERVGLMRADLESELRALDQMSSPRPAVPGIGCYGCPYVIACDEARAESLRSGDDLKTMARAYVLADSLRAAIGKGLRAAAKTEAVRVDDWEIGYLPKAKRRPVDEAARLLVGEWGADERAVGLLMAMGGPTVSGIERLAKVLHETKKGREAMLADLVHEVTVAEFGARRVT